jgi:ribosomal silencing factor RsfS
MTFQIQVHIAGDDPVVLDVDELPSLTDQWIVGTNPRRRDQKEVAYILREVNQVMFPINRVNFIQVLPSEHEEEVPTFVRE